MLSSSPTAKAEGEMDEPPPPVQTAPEPHMEPAPPPPSAPIVTASPSPSPEPGIEAKEFDVKYIRASTSKNIYLFEQTSQQPSEELPQPGRILLLRVAEKTSEPEMGLPEPVMAIRVLKTYPELKQFAGKRVQSYPKSDSLEPLGQFKALEKTGDIIPPVQTSQDKADLKELETPPATPGVSPSPSPSPSPKVDAKASAKEEEDGSTEEAKVSEASDDEEKDSGQATTIEEAPDVTYTPHWLTLEFGLLKNNTGSGSTTYLSAGGLRYGYSVLHMMALRKPTLYDSLTLEGGLFYYKVLGFFVSNDAYTVVPIVGTVRYNIHFGESKGFFIYGGLMKNNVISQINGTDANIALLGSANIAAGVGFMLQIGPGWEGRLDLGLDTIGAGIMLRF